MSRVFTKNTSNFVSLGANALGARLNGAKQITFSAWVFPTSLDVNTTDNVLVGVVINGAVSVGIRPCIGSNPSKNTGSARSVSGDTLQTKNGSVTITTNKWWLLGVTFDFVAKTIQLWTNGAADGTAQAATWTNTSYTNGAPTGIDMIGSAGNGAGSAGTTSQVAGNIADAAVWNCPLAAVDWNALWGGARPGVIRPNSLVSWWPLDVGACYIVDRGWGQRPGKQTGAIGLAGDPPRPGRAPRRRRLLIGATSSIPVGAGNITLGALGVSGAALDTAVSSGAITLGSLVVAGAGLDTSVASGAITLGSLVVAGAGLDTATATGAITLGSLVVAGSGGMAGTASGAITLGTLGVSGAGVFTDTATGAITLGSLVVAGAGAFKDTATGAITLGSLVIAGAAVDGATGAGAITLGSLVVVGVASGTAIIFAPIPLDPYSTTTLALAGVLDLDPYSTLLSTSPDDLDPYSTIVTHV